MQMSQAPIPITDVQLEKFAKETNALIRSISWKPTLTNAQPGTRRTISQPASSPELKPLLVIAEQISQNDELLLSEGTLKVLSTVRRGLRIGLHLADLFAKSTGLDTLIQLQQRSQLRSENQLVEYREKNATASIIGLFCASFYIVWALSRYRTDEVSNVSMEYSDGWEINQMSPIIAYSSMMYYYVFYLEKMQVKSEVEFVKASLLFFQHVIDDIKERIPALKHSEAFATKNYKLTTSDFSINGFEAEVGSEVISVVFNRVRFEQIVGNRIAKHSALRIIERLLCYDFERKRNPYLDLGGFPNIRMGYGKPGTGKSMLIAAIGTKLDERCRDFNYPFLFWPLPDTLISSFQGQSAERMMDWIRPQRDPTKIIYAPIDDAESNFGTRTSHRSSEGENKVIEVFLRNTEGAYAVNYGNSIMDLYTNLPERIDEAVLNRIQDRFPIEGAETREDFLDQDQGWWKKYAELDSNFINMIVPKGYDFFSTQGQSYGIKKEYEKLTEPKNDKISGVLKKVYENRKYTEHEFYSTLYAEVIKKFPRFSSRDIRNIQTTVSSRIMDFDLESDWFNKPDLFFFKNYEAKLNMLIELMKANMGGLSFADVRLQESIRYLDNMARIASLEKDRTLQEMKNQILLQREAVRLAALEET